MKWQQDYNTLYTIKENAEVVRKNSKVSYYNISNSFDIEVSSFYENNEKRACMYVWAMCIDGYYFTGRTWNEFLNLIDNIIKVFEVSIKKRFVIYVHSLAYEMQFIKHYFNFINVLANRQREPINCLCETGIEFRCSYLLSGYSLKTLAEIYLNGRVEKLVGDLDYSLLRLPEVTPLTEQEYHYLFNDVRIVYEYIKDKITNGEPISSIPNTKTGYVRRLLKLNCVGGPPVRHMRTEARFIRYRKFIQSLTISGPEEYNLMLRGFQGGFTHCSCINEGKVFDDVASFDFTSSYPTCLIAFPEYPISPGRKVKVTTLEQLDRLCKTHFCLFDVKFTNLQSKIIYEHYISQSKSVIHGDYIVDNGRIAEADELITTITNIDFDIIKECYTWDNIAIGTCFIYVKGYLPTPFVKTILELYEKKTTLKGVTGRESEYQSAKENINALYGACVQKVVKDSFTIEHGEWVTTSPDIEKEIDRYNRTFNRVLFFPWGVCCTALARRNLWFGGIFNFKTDYIYSDTDSIKVMNYNTPEHKKAIKDYNRYITNMLKTACDFHHIPYSALKPKTIKGESKPLGVWDFEGAGGFKALRSKCYITYKNGHFKITNSGFSGDKVVEYLTMKYGNDLFSHFNNKLYIPKGYTGKNTHTYIDEPIEGDAIDYLGNKGHYKELSCVHLEATDYHLELSPEYLLYLLKVVNIHGEY